MDTPIIVILALGSISVGLFIWLIILDSELEQSRGYAKRLEREKNRLALQLDAVKRQSTFELLRRYGG